MACQQWFPVAAFSKAPLKLATETDPGKLAFIHFVTSFLFKSWSFALACWHGRRLPGFVFRGPRLALV